MMTNTGGQGALPALAPIDEPLVSLVVATYRRSAEVQAMLQSMLLQTERRFELIIVDQNLDDRLVPLLKPVIEAGIPLKHVRLKSPGVAAARNAGLEHVSSKLVGFPDDDCVYEPDVVAKVVAQFAADPALNGIVGHWVELDPAGQRKRERLTFDDWRRFKGGDVACFVLFFRMPPLRAIGGFSEYLGVGRYFGSAEEEDLVFRLLGAGYAIDYSPDINIHHKYIDRPQFDFAQRRRNRLYGRGTGAVQAKHRLPIWVIGRGLCGPLYHGLRSPNPATGFVLAGYTILGRIEGLAGWWLWGRRLAANPSSTPL